MPRVLGIDIPKDKKIYIALTYIKGIGVTTSKQILKKAKIDADKRASSLTDAEIATIRNIKNEEDLKIEGELRSVVSSNIKRLKDIRCYRGLRHRQGRTVHGQKTRYNRKRKGKAIEQQLKRKSLI